MSIRRLNRQGTAALRKASREAIGQASPQNLDVQPVPATDKPARSATNAEMRAWLRSQGIDSRPNATKAQLWALIQEAA